MSSRLLLVAVLAVLFLPAWGNTLNPFCTSARPAPLVASLAPSTVAFSDVESGAMLTINGSQFVSASQVVINGKTLGATIVSSEKLKIMLTTSVISGPGPATVSVVTPSGNTGDLGCTSGGKSSALVLTIN